jgi:hypothetical protein
VHPKKPEKVGGVTAAPVEGIYGYTWDEINHMKTTSNDFIFNEQTDIRLMTETSSA